MKNIFFLSVIVISLSSCNFYKPAMINAPVLEEKGELNLGGNIGIISSDGDFEFGTDIAASYTLTKHLAITSSLNLNLIDVVFSSGTKFMIGSSYSGAVGYYKKSKEQPFNYNFFAGYSAGNTSGSVPFDDGITTPNNYSPYTQNFFLSAKYTSFFVQSAGFAKLDDNIYLGIVAKISALEFSNFKHSRTNLRSDYLSDKTQTVGQVAIQIASKGQKGGYIGQVKYAFTDSSDPYFTLGNFGIHWGVYFRLDEIFKKNN